MRVLDAAILRALAAIAPRRVRLQPGQVDLAGDRVGLAAQRRHPERVDHVGADQPDPHRLADGNVDFVGDGEHARGFVVQVARLPPPLLPGDFDRDDRARWRPFDRREHGNGPEQHDQKRHRRDADAEPDPAQPVAAGCDRHARDRRGRRTARDHADDHEGGDDDDDDDGNRQHAPVEREHRIGHRALAGHVGKRDRRVRLSREGGERDCQRRDGAPHHGRTGRSDASANRRPSPSMATARKTMQPGIHMIAPPSCWSCNGDRPHATVVSACGA